MLLIPYAMPMPIVRILLALIAVLVKLVLLETENRAAQVRQ